MINTKSNLWMKYTNPPKMMKRIQKRKKKKKINRGYSSFKKTTTEMQSPFCLFFNFYKKHLEAQKAYNKPVIRIILFKGYPHLRQWIETFRLNCKSYSVSFLLSISKL